MFARTRWLVVASAFTFALRGDPTPAAPVPAAGGDNGLAMVPAQAPIVVHLRGVERTKDRLTAMLNKAVPDFGPGASAHLDNLLQSGFEGRKLQGLTKDGSAFLAFLEMPAPNVDPPPVALIARVTGYAEFRAGLLNEDERKNVKRESGGFERAEINGREFFFVDLKDYAALTPSKDVATLIAKKPEGLGGKLSPETARSLVGSDLSVYVNLAAVNREYGEQIKSGRQFIDTILDSMPGGAAEKAQMEMAKAFFGGAFQVIEDGRAVVLALDFRPEGLALHLQAQVGADTKTNTFLKETRPSPLTDLGTLPAGQTVYTAAHFGPSVFKALAPMIFGAIGGEGEAKKQVEAALQQLIAAGNTASYSAGSFPPSGVQVTEFRDPAQAAEAQLKLFRAMGEGGTFQSAYIKGKPEIKENAQEYKGFKLNFASVTWDLDKLAEQVPGGGEGVKAAMKKMMGEGLKMWFGTDGRRTITVTAKDWDAAKAQIDAYLGGGSKLAQEEPYKATRRELPAEASILLLADAGKFSQVMLNYMLALFKAMPGLPFKLPDEVKPVKTETSFIGAAVTLKPEYGSFDLFLPVTAVQEIRKVVQPLFQGGAE
jgi:hypothetical protein